MPYIIATAVFLVLLALIAWYLLDLSGRALRRQRRAEHERDEVVNFLNRFASSILNAEDAGAWMDQVARYLAETVGASAIRIFMLNENGKLTPTAHYGELPPLPRGEDFQLTRGNRILAQLHSEEIEVGEGLIGEAAFSDKSTLIEDIAESPLSGDRVSLRTLLLVPMVLNEQGIGIICAANKRVTGALFSSDDLFLLEALASQVALGGTLIQAHEALKEKSRLEQELKLAQHIQESLLPTRFPQSRSFRTYAVNIPAREVSGDFYDFVEIDERFLLIVIADASGKGVPACLLMAGCRSFVRANAARFKEDLEGLFKELNTQIRMDTDGAQFVTMACLLVDRQDNTVEYARAGHTELILRNPDGDVQVIQPDGPALGLLPADFEVEFDTFSFSLRRGVSMLLFTDGITEALNDAEEEYGLEKLVDVWATQSADPAEACLGVLESVESFIEHHPQADDQTVVVLSRVDNRGRSPEEAEAEAEAAAAAAVRP